MRGRPALARKRSSTALKSGKSWFWYVSSATGRRSGGAASVRTVLVPPMSPARITPGSPSLGGAGARTQALHGRRHAAGVPEHCRARHQHPRARGHDDGGGPLVDPTVDLELTLRSAGGKQLPHPADLRLGRRDELLAAEAGVDG